MATRTGAADGSNLSVTIASGDVLDVREFQVDEAMSSLFTITLRVVAENPDIDFEAVVGQPARFAIQGGAANGSRSRTWTGLCSQLFQLAVEEDGLSTYHVEIVPVLWLSTQRRNHRMFQLKSEIDIVLALLSEWGIEPLQRLSGTYKKRKYRVQYGESDFTFMSRMLEDAGVSFHFVEEGGETKLVLTDAPHTADLREPKIAFQDTPMAADREHVTALRIGRRVRPGRYTMRDHDYRGAPTYKLLAEASVKGGVEEKLERFHYTPGAFLYESDKGEATPNADDKGRYRTDEAEASALAQRRLDAKRAEAMSCSFDTNVMELGPGVVMSVLGHPRRDLGEDKRLLIVESSLGGTNDGEWAHHCEARSAGAPYRPALKTPKPKAMGVESATVVGPAGEEIHCDEFGRVRVHFHWDRESQMDDASSCWIHVSQPWGGAGFGGVNLPRVGQEVIVDFLGADPDRPIIVGRVYTNLQKVPFKLPDNKTQSGWKSNSTTGTGGYNELMFEDSAGKELLRMQAEKDMTKLVKNDEQSTVGRDRTRLVKRNETITIGKNLTKQVVANEREITGANRTITVGVNRSAQIGAIDSTMVGDTHTVFISPPGEGGAGPSASTTMKDKSIVLDTGGGATIRMDNDTIVIEAKQIIILASDDLSMAGMNKGLLGGGNHLHLGSASGDVVIKGGPMVKVNP